MFEQAFEGFRRASESSLQLQQELFRTWAQQWLSTPPNVGVSTEWGRTFQKRWTELTIELLNKHRESIETAYKSGIELAEHAFRVSDAKSSEDYRRIAEEMWRKLFETLKIQSENQLRDFLKLAESSFDMAQKATG